MKKFLLILLGLICTNVWAAGCPDDFEGGFTIGDFCVLKKATTFAAAAGACRAIPANCHLATPREACPSWNGSDIGEGKCPHRSTSVNGVDQDSFVWINKVYTPPAKAEGESEAYDPEINPDANEPRAWHLLLSKGSIYHYQQDRYTRPLCHCQKVSNSY